MLDCGDPCLNGLRCVLEQEGLADLKGLRMQPDNRCLEILRNGGRCISTDDDVAAADVEFVSERNDHGEGSDCLLQISVESGDGLHRAPAARRQRNHGVARSNRTRSDLTGEAAEMLMRTDDTLNGHPEGETGVSFGHGHCLKEFEQAGSGVPRHPCAACDDVVALERADRYALEFGVLQSASKLMQIALKFFEYILRVADQVHLVYGDNQLGDAKQRGDVSMAARLCQDPFARIHQNDCKVG